MSGAAERGIRCEVCGEPLPASDSWASVYTNEPYYPYTLFVCAEHAEGLFRHIYDARGAWRAAEGGA